jgi:hypothetical protein
MYYLNALDIEHRAVLGLHCGFNNGAGRSYPRDSRDRRFPGVALRFCLLLVPFTPQPDAGFLALGFESIFESLQFIDKTSGASRDLNTAITDLNTANPIQSRLSSGTAWAEPSLL